MLSSVIDLPPRFFTPVPDPPGSKPRLFVVVDTEEEFDWSAPFSRQSTSVTAIADVWRLQQVLSPYGAVPTYVIDYPVASTEASAQTLAGYAARGECQIGAHLHPWVNPPHQESLGARNSYACNLGIDLEREKIARLRDAIVTGLGVVPRVYKAGRYGFGPTSAHVLELLGFDVDASVNPYMNFKSDGGPSFEELRPVPAFFGSGRRLLEVPCTTGFVGSLRRYGQPLHRAASSSPLSRMRAVGVLSRSGAVNRVMLSPEGSTLDEMKALTQALLEDGVRSFSFTFHSPSLKPGCTPYVRTEADRDAFLRTIDQYCDFFFGRIGGVASTPADWYDQLSRSQAS
jgi:hypothetical protein